MRPFCPAHAVHNLTDVDPQALANRGIKLILVDVDNTLVKWRTEDFAEETLNWVQKVKSAGIQACIISNTRNVVRLGRLSEILGIPAMRGRFKPSTAMYEQALEKFGVKKSQAVMIGDQLFTDILGANRAGIEAIWLQPISGSDFVATKVNRFGERVLRGYLYRALHEPIDEEPETPEEAARTPFLERKVVRQFVKFCIVGGSSFVIDYCIRMTLLYASPFSDYAVRTGEWLRTHVSLFSFAETPRDAFFPIAALCAASLAILNSFYWNRLWTFKIRGSHERMDQLKRFVAISLIGLV
ncbi:MAG: hypothetical protein QOJ65_298, partial [Fimbriimonadaceae bacterium]|nr:hypothetical protein [Fimbriimonadaceae bacterium]